MSACSFPARHRSRVGAAAGRGDGEAARAAVRHPGHQPAGRARRDPRPGAGGRRHRRRRARRLHRLGSAEPRHVQVADGANGGECRGRLAARPDPVRRRDPRLLLPLQHAATSGSSSATSTSTMRSTATIEGQVDHSVSSGRRRPIRARPRPRRRSGGRSDRCWGGKRKRCWTSRQVSASSSGTPLERVTAQRVTRPLAPTVKANSTRPPIPAFAQCARVIGRQYGAGDLLEIAAAFAVTAIAGARRCRRPRRCRAPGRCRCRRPTAARSGAPQPLA